MESLGFALEFGICSIAKILYQNFGETKFSNI